MSITAFIELYECYQQITEPEDELGDSLEISIDVRSKGHLENS